MKDITSGKKRIEKLADTEMRLIQDLSSTTKMKKDVQTTLDRLRKRNNSLAPTLNSKEKLKSMDEESAMILDQFNVEYQSMKRNIYESHHKSNKIDHKGIMINEESCND